MTFPPASACVLVGRERIIPRDRRVVLVGRRVAAATASVAGRAAAVPLLCSPSCPLLEDEASKATCWNELAPFNCVRWPSAFETASRMSEIAASSSSRSRPDLATLHRLVGQRRDDPFVADGFDGAEDLAGGLVEQDIAADLAAAWIGQDAEFGDAEFGADRHLGRRAADAHGGDRRLDLHAARRRDLARSRRRRSPARD